MLGHKSIYRASAGFDFDPTSGGLGKIGLVTVAVVRDPRRALPLHGTFFGFSSDHLGMEVQASGTSGMPEADLGHASTLQVRPTGLIDVGDADTVG